MQYKGHIATGLIASFFVAAISKGLGFKLSPTEYFLAVVAGSILPDIDTPKSLIGKFTFPISIILYYIFGHRGIIHSLVVGIGIGLTMWGTDSSFAFGFMVGYITHLLMDCLTPMGVPRLLFPLRAKD